MGMGNYSCHADIVTDGFVKETCPEEMNELQIALDHAEYEWEQLANCGNFGGDIKGELEVDLDEDEVSKIIEVYEKLCKTFQKKTGLELNIKYHNKEDRGDEVDGMFWEVDGVYILSPAGEKYKDKIERKFWTVFG